jgi:hypothetical protein
MKDQGFKGKRFKGFLSLAIQQYCTTAVYKIHLVPKIVIGELIRGQSQNGRFRSPRTLLTPLILLTGKKTRG